MQTTVNWEDTGKDCQYCGGQIFRRTERDLNNNLQVRFQCRTCNARGRSNWELSHAGDESKQQRPPVPAASTRLGDRVESIPTWAKVVFALLLAAILIRFGGLAIIRPLIPIAILAVVIFFIYRLGREQEWW